LGVKGIVAFDISTKTADEGIGLEVIVRVVTKALQKSNATKCGAVGSTMA
jgi:hypothetical protein